MRSTTMSTGLSSSQSAGGGGGAALLTGSRLSALTRLISVLFAGSFGKLGGLGFGPIRGARGLPPSTGGGGLPVRGNLLLGPGGGSCGGGRFPPYGWSRGAALCLAAGGGDLKGGAALLCLDRGCEA